MIAAGAANFLNAMLWDASPCWLAATVYLHVSLSSRHHSRSRWDVALLSIGSREDDGRGIRLRSDCWAILCVNILCGVEVDVLLS
jgi:hypothetical protein